MAAQTRVFQVSGQRVGYRPAIAGLIPRFIPGGEVTARFALPLPAGRTDPPLAGSATRPFFLPCTS